MSQSPPSTPSSTPFETIFRAAADTYRKQTKKDIASHPLAAQLNSCDTPDAILAVLRAQVRVLDRTQSVDEKLTKWLDPTVNVLCAFSETLGNAVGLAFPPATVIFTGIGVLLQAIKDVRASRHALVDLFSRIEFFFKRLQVHTEVPPTPAMTDMIVKIMAEVLSMLGMVTKEIGRGPIKKYFKRLVGWTGPPVEAAVQRLDSLTLQEEQMAVAESLRIDRKINDTVKDVQGSLEGIYHVVQSVGLNVQGFDDNMQNFKDKLQGVGDTVNLVVEGGKELVAAIQPMGIQVGYLNQSQKRQDLRRLLSCPDTSTFYNKACGAQLEGTATWCTKSSTFADWKSSGSLLWIHGKPGSGKSVVSSAIIQELQALSDSGEAHIAYFYFQDTEKYDFRGLLSSLLIQLSQSEQFGDILRGLCSKNQNDSGPPTQSLVQCLKKMLSIPGQIPIYLILDALDECPSDSPPSRDKVLNLVEELVELRLPNLRLCVTSCPEYDIRAVLEPLATQRLCLHDEREQKQDIHTYVTSKVRSDQLMKKWPVEDQDMVIAELVGKADGMFRWVSFQFEVLRYCPRVKLRRTLNELPKALDETYERILKRINEANREPARQLFRCLTVAVRPLRVEELAEMYAIDFNAEGTNEGWRWEDQKDAVLSACSSFVSVTTDGGDQVVQFSHFSVKQFLTSDRLAAHEKLSKFHIPLEPAHAILTNACLNVLHRLDDHTDSDSIKADPLLPYAASCWVKHAQFRDVESRTDIQDAMDSFFDTANPHFSAWVRIQRLHDLFEAPPGSETPTDPSAAPLYFAAYCGFRSLAKRIIDKHPQYVSACCGKYGTPLHSSMLGGHIEVAQLLLAHGGADVNAPGTFSLTPLDAASQVGRLGPVKWLLDQGANVNAQRVNGQTALQAAVLNGRLDVARMLIARGADVDARDADGYTALALALEGVGGGLDSVRLLLDNNANASPRDNNGKTPLHIAAARGHLEAAQLLLDHKADCNAQDVLGVTPLLFAASTVQLGLMRLLLDRGADANLGDNSGNTNLHHAAINTVTEVVPIMFEYNTDVNARNHCGSTPLHLASEEGDLGFVSLLLDHGADVQARDNRGNTPLQIASTHGHPEVVQILLDHDVEVDTQSDDASTPSHSTEEEGDFDAVCASLDRFAEAQVRNNGGKTSTVAGDWEQQRIVPVLSA